jgi:hypothetical protein
VISSDLLHIERSYNHYMLAEKAIPSVHLGAAIIKNQISGEVIDYLCT